MKSETENSTIKRDGSPPSSPRGRYYFPFICLCNIIISRFQANISSLSNNVSAINDDDTLIRDRNHLKTLDIVTDASNKASSLKDTKLKTQTSPLIVMTPLPSPVKIQTRVFINSKMYESFDVGLIYLYTIVVLVILVLYNGSDTTQTLMNVIQNLEYLELAIITLFILEVLLKIWALGLKVNMMRMESSITLYRNTSSMCGTILILCSFLSASHS